MALEPRSPRCTGVNKQGKQRRIHEWRYESGCKFGDHFNGISRDICAHCGATRVWSKRSGKIVGYTTIERIA